MRQVDAILDYMKEHGGITNREAAYLGCYRLSGRIFDLRKEGYNIMTEYKRVTNRLGGHSTIGVYKLKGEKDGGI